MSSRLIQMSTFLYPYTQRRVEKVVSLLDQSPENYRGGEAKFDADVHRAQSDLNVLQTHPGKCDPAASSNCKNMYTAYRKGGNDKKYYSS